MRLRTERARFLVENLDLKSATGVDDARWEHFQLAHLQDDGTFRIEDKSRQIAWSWLIAAEAVADAILDGRDSIFVSINQEESQGKIRYAKAAYENLYVNGLPKIKRDSLTNIELDNGARLTSLPARSPRGRARANIYLDEFAHAKDDRRIYTAALPVTSKGGRIRIGSSPFGATGVFWEIFEETLREYPGYRRKTTPWWHAWSFCINVAEAVKLAPAMPTAHRVELFGNDRIKAIYANMPEEDFQQEYEALFVDEARSWITWDEIQSIQDDGLWCQLVECTGGDIGAALEAIGRVWLESVARKIEDGFAVGVDVGRTRNTTEIYALGLSTVDTYPLRMGITLDNMDFNSQYAVLAAVLDRLPVTKMRIDRNGIGLNLAENLEKAYPIKAEGVDFTNASKRAMATNIKMLVQQKKVPIPVDRDMAYQIHSIKRLITPSKNLVFDTETNEKHHADKFWAWALAGSEVNVEVGSFSMAYA